MKPITVSVDVPQPPDRVFAFLDVMRNHERFNDHLLTGWSYSGPDRGVGSAAHVTARAGGRSDAIAIETVASEPPRAIVERNVGAGGRREANGTYRLEPLPAGGTRIEFEYAWSRAPRSERLLAPVVRSVMRSSLTRSMERLAAELGAAA